MTYAEIQEKARLGGYTERFIIEAGCDDLYVLVKPETDFDDVFRAICEETGDLLRFNGWNVTVRELDF